MAGADHFHKIIMCIKFSQIIEFARRQAALETALPVLYTHEMTRIESFKQE